MRFHLWYLKERKYIQRLDNGTLAITVEGVDEVMSRGGPDALHLLQPGPEPAGDGGAGDGGAEEEGTGGKEGAEAPPKDRMADWM
jgi:hypothetical protein